MSQNINIITNRNQQEQKKQRQKFQKEYLWPKLSQLNQKEISSNSYLLGDLNGSNRQKYYNNVLKIIGDKLYPIYKKLQNDLKILYYEFEKIKIKRSFLQRERTITRLSQVNKEICDLKNIQKQFKKFSKIFIEECYEDLKDRIHNEQEIRTIVDDAYKRTKSFLL
jgi:hypothetical protein